MTEQAPVQVFVRNEKGHIWGPLEPGTVELLIGNGTIAGRLQVSLDGERYVFPGRVPHVRQAFPRDQWGDVIAEGDDIATGTATPGPAAAVAPNAGAAAKPAASMPMAGPGAMKNAQVRRSPTDSGVHRAIVDRKPLDLGTKVQAPPPAADAQVINMSGVAGPPSVSLGSLGGAQVINMSEAKAPVALGDEPEEVPDAGDLSQHSPVRLYYLAASTNATGLLTLVLPDRTLDIHFRKGNPEYVNSSHPGDALGAYLVAQRMITEAQLATAWQKASSFGGELTAALFGLGLLNPGTAVQHLVQHASGLLFQALVADHGTFKYERKDLPAAKAMPLGNRWSILSDAVRRFPIAELKRRLGDAIELPIMKATGQVAVSDLRLTAQEARALAVFDGARSVAQLLKALPQEADHLVRTAFFLKEVDAVSFAAIRPRPPSPSGLHAVVEPVVPPPPAPLGAVPLGDDPVPTPSWMAAVKLDVAKPVAKLPTPVPSIPPVKAVAPAVAPAKPVAAAAAKPAPTAKAVPKTATPPLPVDLQAELANVVAFVMKMNEQNHFEVLGLQPNAAPNEVKMAYFKLAKVYHPDTVPPGAPEGLGKAKADVFARIGEAHRVLSDDKQRAEYVEALKAGNVGEQVDVGTLLAAEESFQKGMILVKSRKFPEALKYLDEAIAANPDEGEYYAWRGYARFFLNADKKVAQAEAQKDIQQCTARNPKVAAAAYFLGHIAKLVGDNTAAKNHFKHCLELNPEHLDAQREMRLMK
ncbi:MAG: DnaJ domain-containing protein [Myxococcaceae bacterium]|nr:DnaJ domain-containing protein [Myxococcaceae bacterium]